MLRFFGSRLLVGSISLLAVAAIAVGVVARDGAAEPGELVSDSAPRTSQADGTEERRGRDLLDEGSSANAIAVHGHWTLTILDPDGTLVRRVEFENALQPGANVYLATVLAGDITAGPWAIALAGAPNACFQDAGPSTQFCQIAESSWLPGLPAHSLDLTVTPNAGVLELRGSVIVDTDGAFVAVLTRVWDGAAILTITSADIAAEPVSAGQQVQVAVDLSFE